MDMLVTIDKIRRPADDVGKSIELAAEFICDLA